MKKNKSKREAQLIQDICNLEQKDILVYGELLDEKKKELYSLRQEKLAGHMIRARTQWLSEGEKPSKLFCSLENKNYVEKTIKKIHLTNGLVIQEQKKILKEI